MAPSFSLTPNVQTSQPITLPDPIPPGAFIVGTETYCLARETVDSPLNLGRLRNGSCGIALGTTTPPTIFERPTFQVLTDPDQGFGEIFGFVPISEFTPEKAVVVNPDNVGWQACMTTNEGLPIVGYTNTTESPKSCYINLNDGSALVRPEPNFEVLARFY